MASSVGKLARTREQKKKTKDLSRELAKEKSKNVALKEALERSLKENEVLQASISKQDDVRRMDAPNAPDDPEIEFNVENGLSSTRRVAGPSFEESKFLSSMNQLSVASINVPECKATDDDGIHRHTYEQWKDLLIDSLKLAGIEDETTKFTVFKVKAGSRLLEIFRNTKSHIDSPDATREPFSNALHRLQSYFGSGSDVMLMRRKLAMMSQNRDETDHTFLTRVGSTARLCEFDEDKEFEQIVATVAEHARHREVRTTALKMLSRKGTFIDLVDKVREIETIRLNEEYVMRRHGNAEQALVAPVRSFSNSDATHQQSYPSSFGSRGGVYQRGGYRGYATRPSQMHRGGNFQAQTNRGHRFQPRFNRGGGFQSSSSSATHCWRCGGVYHSPNDCTVKDKICNKCGQLGHIRRVCFGQFKRAGEEVLDIPPNKIAAIEVREKSEEPKVEDTEIKTRSKTIARTGQSLTDEEKNIYRIDGCNDQLQAIASTGQSLTVEEENIHWNERLGCGSNMNVNSKGDSSLNNVNHAFLNPSHMHNRVPKELSEGVIMAVVAGLKCPFLIDSGAQVNTFTLVMFKQIMSDSTHSSEMFNVRYDADRPLKAYATAGEIKVLATFHAYLYISDDRPTLLEKFYVVEEVRALLSRSTACRYSVLMLGLKVPVHPSAETSIEIERFRHAGEIASISATEVFPKFNIPAVKIHYDKTKPPCRNVFFNIPLAVKPLVEERLQGLVAANIIESVTDGMDTSFCSSMLVVPKGKDDFRLVIDLRGPNQYIYRTPFAMPTLEKILAKLEGATWFSTIDLSNAFFHIELDEESRHLTNFFTEFGMYRYVRLPFGLCNAPDLFQESLQRKVLGECEGCVNYLDDILVFGRTKEEHDQNLAEVRSRLANHNVRLNESKCVFGSQEVKFIGFILTPRGWQIEEEKIAAIKEFRRPVNCAEVKSFLGLITYIDKFIVHRATKTECMRALANSDVFYWTDNEEAEFEYLKGKALSTIKTLGYYNPNHRIELFVDASPSGLGAVLIQFDETNNPRIIACASKVLSQSEQRYPQTQKEALAVVWGVERFSCYLLARSFVIWTDAEANKFIFNTNHRLGKRAVSRAEGWVLRLQPYDFVIKCVPGDQNMADVLSRLVSETQAAVAFEDNDDKHFLYALDAERMEITWSEIESMSEQDIEVQSVIESLSSKKWPKELRSYEAQRKHLFSMGPLLFKNERVVLPRNLRLKAIKSAHGGHVGEMATKRIMRQYFWWPKMSNEITRFIKGCEICTLLSRRNPPLPLSPRELPHGPWEILQIDFLTVPHFGTGEFLVVTDTFSRYLAVVEMKAMDAGSTNSALCAVFHTWGLSIVIQSDNGPPFQSSAFNTFWEEKGVSIRKAIPLSPQSNGAVERQNQGIIKTLSCSKLEGTNWRTALQDYVHRHNTLVPHSRLNVTPFEMMTGWKYRGIFPGLRSGSSSCSIDITDVRERDAEYKLSSKKYADSVRGAKESNIAVGDIVLLAQQKKSKTDPTFSLERYRVIARDAAKVVVMSTSGVQYTRNVQEVKIAPALHLEGCGEKQLQHSNEEIATDLQNSSSVTEEYRQSLQHEELSRPSENLPPSTEAAHGSEQGTSEKTSSSTGVFRSLRDRGTIKRPSRFDDFVYHVFH